MISNFTRVMALLVVAVSAFAAPPRAEHVFIISIDGGAPANIKQSRMPVLMQLAREGAVTWTAQTVRPSITLPAHTSMLTGVPVAKHGISWNDWIATNPIVSVPTVFTVAKAAGRGTAMFVAKEKFKQLLQPGTVDEFWFDQAAGQAVLKSDSGSKKGLKMEVNIPATAVATAAAKYIERHKPGVCFIHFADPDSVGHKHGWGSPEQLKAFAEVDAALGVLRDSITKAGLATNSVLLITADHGGKGKGHSEDIPENMTIPWIAWGPGVKANFQITELVNTCDTAATALWLLGLKPTAPLDGAVVTSAFE